MSIDNFLIPDINQIRHSIRDIDDSYNNDWDLLAELCQNAVDAIRLSDSDPGIIQLDINSVNKSIKITDNGIGINPDEMPILLKPFATNKYGSDSQIGEKGVGLTYVMFSSNHFEITSGNENGSSKGLVENAYIWKQLNDSTRLPLKHSPIDEQIQGTTVVLNDIKDSKIFNYTYEQLRFVLLTKTALGNTLSIWEDDKNITITVKFIDQNNVTHKENIPYKYWSLLSDLRDNEKIDLDNFIEYARAADRSDLDKRRKLQDRVIYKEATLIRDRDNREINYLAFYVPTRNTWNKLSIHQKLCTEDQLDSEEYLENFGYAKFQPGITVSIKGMPTGIFIDHPSTGFAGYWSNVFILFEDKKLKFDIGRKAIHGNLTHIYKKYSKKIFNEFLKYVSKYVTGEIPVDEDWNKDEIFGEIDSIIDLDCDYINFKKSPRDQEASVAAIFFECIGKGLIKDITPLISGYRNKYDLYALWGHRKVVMEFKSKLSNIIRDFSDQQKMFNHIDCVVCWDVDEEDAQTFLDKAVSLLPIENNILSERQQEFPNATHKLVLTSFVDPIYVIDMKKYLESIDEE